MRFLLTLCLLLCLASSAFAAELDEDIWGSKAQGWESLSSFELSADSVVVELNQHALLLNNNESAPLLSKIAAMGPRPFRTGNKQQDVEGFFAWNTKLEKDVLQTKLGNSFWDEMNRPDGQLPRATADEWYAAFLSMRRLRLYEAAGYKVIGLESVPYSDAGMMHLFLLVKAE
jgi:hypothetical protein